MRTFNFTLLAATLGYVAVIGASPLGVRAPAESVDRRNPTDPPYCDKYPDGTGCSTACEVNPLQQKCVDLCDRNIHLSFCPGAPPPTRPSKSRALVEGIGRRQYPHCDENNPDAPGCDGSDAPSCDVDPLQQSCVELCKQDPELPFCGGSSGSGATPPAGPAPAKDVRRQYPDCDQYPDAPGCGPDICDVYPELCGPSNSD